MADVFRESPANWPWVGFVRSFFPNLANSQLPFAVGTAFLIDPSVALTAAHVVYDTFSGYLHFPRKPIGEQAPLTKSRHLTCVAGNYHSPGPSGRSRGNYSSELSGQSELPFGRRQTVQRAGGLPRRSSPGPAGPLTCRRRKIGAHDALPSRRRFCVFWESAVVMAAKPKAST